MNVLTDIRFTNDAIAEFARWSHDVNPLHIDESFAGDTPFGSNIVHGVVSVIEALRYVEYEKNGGLNTLEVEFRDAIYPGEDYSIELIDRSDEHRFAVNGKDGRSALAVRYTVDDAAVSPPAPDDRMKLTPGSDSSLAGMRNEPVDRALEDIGVGFELTGIYETAEPGTDHTILSGMDTRVMGLCSYLVGMEVPGLRSLFTRLKLRFFHHDGPSNRLQYRLSVARLDPKFRIVTCNLEVGDSDGRRVAAAEIRSYFRFSPAEPNLKALEDAFACGTGEALSGKVALICGGTRGLGASLSSALAVAGCHVYASFKGNVSSAQKIERRLVDRGLQFECLQGDCGDEQWCRATVDRIREEHGRIDILVLNACAPPRPYRFSGGKSDAFESFLRDNLPLIQAPLKAAFDTLESARGSVVAISSSYVELPVPEFAPYVALKQATEGCIQSAARDSRTISWFLPRPPRLQTSWNDTPTGVLGTVPADDAAAAIVRDLGATEDRGVSIRSEFPDLPRERGETVQVKAAQFTIVLSSTFTIEPILPGLKFWTSELDLDACTEIAPYGQVLQELLNPSSRTSENTKGINIILLRLSDWLRERRHSNDIEPLAAAEFIGSTVAEFVDAVKAHRARAAVQTLLILCPSDPEPEPLLADAISTSERDLADALSGVPGLRVIDPERFHEHYSISGKEGVFDPLRNDIAHVPFTDSYYHVLATIAARSIFREVAQKRKVVVVDCDNTLWRGVVGEAGVDGISFESAHKSLHAKLVELSANGVLVCLCSKNDEADVWRVFAERTDFALPRDQIVASMINWEPKSTNLRRLAERLNLAPDSFIFIDDNPVECAEVQANCPEILTLQWPEDGAAADSLLRHTWELDSGDATREDEKRTAMYREEFSRQSFLETTVDFGDFIESLSLEIDISLLADEDLKRTSQLTLRTNQFNFATIRRNESEISELQANADYRIWTVKVSDRFGDYGLVGVMIARLDGGTLAVDTFLLSCRVLGRGVEHTMAAALGEFAVSSGLDVVRINYRPSERNEPARAFIESLPGDKMNETNDGFQESIIEAVQLEAVRFEPAVATRSENLEGDVEAVGDAPDISPARATGPRKREAGIRRAAFELGTVVQLAAAIGEDSRSPETTSDVASLPEGKSLEDFVYEVFADALKLPLDEVRAIDDLEALGCDSFRIVEITVALAERYPRIPSTLLFEHQRISEICREIKLVTDPSSERTEKRSTPVRREQGTQGYDLAVVGMSVRCAGASTLEILWDLLVTGDSSVEPVPVRRAGFLGELSDSRGHWAGLLDGVAGFDAEFFGVAPREAEFMDPQLRIFLEAAWTALEDAGAVGTGHETETGVFVGAMYEDYAKYANRDNGKAIPDRCWEGFSLANRASQVFGFDGPSLTINTACSSSGTALHYACESILAGDCRQALVGGLNLILDPARFAQLGRLGILSPEGKCRPFGSEANGTVLGEGVGVILLKSLKDAQRDEDRIYGVIRGTGLSVGAGSVGFTAPNPTAQSIAVRRCIESAACDPRTISYVETHGTGTSLGDPIEIRGLSLAYENPELWDTSIEMDANCSLGSIKPNIGHLEAGAGILGLIKLLMQLHRKILVPSLTSPEPNPAIPFETSPFSVQRERTTWNPPSAVIDGSLVNLPRRGSLNSFGVGGANAHVIVEEAPNDPARPDVGRAQESVVTRPLDVVAVSARSESGLRALAGSMGDFLSTHPDLALGDVAYTANTRRKHFEHRLAVTGGDAESAASRLLDWSRGESSVVGCVSGRKRTAEGKVAFLFTGQGSQYVGMGRALYDLQPVFRDALDSCAGLLEPLLNRPLLDVLFHSVPGEESTDLDQTGYTQPAIFSLQYALSALWGSWGIEPAMVLGHSVGEIAALTVAGGVSLEDGVRMISARGRLMQALPPGGTMLSIGCDETRAQDALQGYESVVSLAALNGPRQVVISGAADAIAEIRAKLESESVKTTPLIVSHAFHSPLMDPMLGEYETVLREINFKVPRTPLFSCVIGDAATEELCTTQYWLDQVRKPVRFTTAMETLSEHGISDYLEIGPHPVLTGLGKAAAKDKSAGWHASLRKSTDAFETILHSVSQLYVNGLSVDWEGFDRPYPVRRTELPTYPFQKKQFWLGGLEDPVPASRVPGVYEICWTPDAKNSTAAGTVPDGSWLVVSLGDEMAVEIGEQLRRSGKECAVVNCGTCSEHRETVDHGVGVDTEDLFGDTFGAGVGASIDHVIYVASARRLKPGDTESAGDVLVETNYRVLEVLRQLVRAMLDSGEQMRLTVVTRIAAPLGGEVLEQSLHGAGVWGFCRTLSVEEPDFHVRVIDLENGPVGAADTDAVLSELSTGDFEDQVAYRNGTRMLPRLVRHSDSPETATATLRSDGIFVITGGLGALGRHVTEWLINKGIGKFILTGRRGIATPDVDAWVSEMVAKGATVQALTADVTTAEGLASITAAVAEMDAPLRGIVHAAGVDHEVTVKRMTPVQLRNVLAPKVFGAWRLHQWSASHDLDVFVMFSSISAIIGAPGRAHYAGGNAFLDALAHYRAARGLPALSIDWGPWAGGGMADEDALKSLAAVGNHGLKAETAVALMDRLLGARIVQATIADIDWARFRPVYEARGPKPMLADLGPVSGTGSEASPPSGSWACDLRDVSATDRPTILNRLIREEIAALLGFGDADEIAADGSVFDLGMDSLLAVEFATRIEQQSGIENLESVLDHPRVDDLAEYVLENYSFDTGNLTGAQRDDRPPPDDAPWANELSRLSGELRIDALGQQLRHTVVEMLGFESLEDVPLEANLFELGMDSLRAVELLAIVQQNLGIEGPPNMLDSPRISDIAKALVAVLEHRTEDDTTTAPTSDDGAIFEFCRHAWPLRRDEWIEPRWRWMFVESATRLGVDPEYWTEQVDEKIVAFTGAIPVVLKVDGALRNTAYLVDTMVLEAHRGRALGPKLLARIGKQKPFSLSLGQSDEMREILNRTGWIEVGQLNIYTLPLRPIKMLRKKLYPIVRESVSWAITVTCAAKRALALRNGTDVVSVEVDEFGHEHEQFLISIRDQYRVGIVRDVSYMNWKYVSQPGRDFVRLEVRTNDGISGIAVFSIDMPNAVYDYCRATLFEFLVSEVDGTHVFPVLDEVRKACQMRDVDSVQFPLMNVQLEALLPAFGFIRREPHRFLMVSSDDIAEVERDVLLSRNNWLVTAGDSDLDRPS